MFSYNSYHQNYPHHNHLMYVEDVGKPVDAPRLLQSLVSIFLQLKIIFSCNSFYMIPIF